MCITVEVSIAFHGTGLSVTRSPISLDLPGDNSKLFWTGCLTPRSGLEQIALLQLNTDQVLACGTITNLVGSIMWRSCPAFSVGNPDPECWQDEEKTSATFNDISDTNAITASEFSAVKN
ncbi:MAG: hypothetical protein MMC33_007598 [Icmadophila ericetorum]|nr:hypothetical protein [Icmadophila ericetorum]